MTNMENQVVTRFQVQGEKGAIFEAIFFDSPKEARDFFTNLQALYATARERRKPEGYHEADEINVILQNLEAQS